MLLLQNLLCVNARGPVLLLRDSGAGKIKTGQPAAGRHGVATCVADGESAWITGGRRQDGGQQNCSRLLCLQGMRSQGGSDPVFQNLAITVAWLERPRTGY